MAAAGVSARPKRSHDRRRANQPPAFRYLDLLGLRARSFSELAVALARGLPSVALERFQRTTDLSWYQIAELIDVPERTLLRRRKTKRLQADESDRLLRASRVVAQAVELFEGELPAARAWLLRPQPALGGATPLSTARTDTGAREVENLIGRLEHGIPS